MKKLLVLLSILAAGAFAFNAAVHADNNGAAPKQGTYRILAKPQPAEVDGKIEVIEFFWYNCSHCYDFEPTLSGWVKSAPQGISFKRVPVVYRDDFLPQARAYYTFEALGKLEELHKKMFTAIHAEKKPLNTPEQIATWAAAQGVDKDAFMKAYSSFSVQSKANRAKQLTDAFEIDGTPTMAVAGKYITMGSMAGSLPAVIQVTEQLASGVKAKKL